MKILVCGDRNWSDYLMIQEQLSARNPTVIIHGGATGADSLADQWAISRGVLCRSYPALWSRYGKAAGPRRNEEMLVRERPDLVLAFHDHIETSKGTKDMLRRAQKAGVEVILYAHSRVL